MSHVSDDWSFADIGHVHNAHEGQQEYPSTAPGERSRREQEARSIPSDSVLDDQDFDAAFDSLSGFDDSLVSSLAPPTHLPQHALHDSASSLQTFTTAPSHFRHGSINPTQLHDAPPPDDSALRSPMPSNSRTTKRRRDAVDESSSRRATKRRMTNSRYTIPGGVEVVNLIDEDEAGPSTEARDEQAARSKQAADAQALNEPKPAKTTRLTGTTCSVCMTEINEAIGTQCGKRQPNPLEPPI